MTWLTCHSPRMSFTPVAVLKLHHDCLRFLINSSLAISNQFKSYCLRFLINSSLRYIHTQGPSTTCIQHRIILVILLILHTFKRFATLQYEFKGLFGVGRWRWGWQCNISQPRETLAFCLRFPQVYLCRVCVCVCVCVCVPKHITPSWIIKKNLWWSLPSLSLLFRF